MADAYPASIRGELDQGTNRFMFLVKWLLLIPHYVLLLFLGIASYFAWIAAAVAILFTGSYPRGLFDFMEGVMRWNWRVTFYGSVLGTDKYPPFSLASDSGYPADLTVEYPESLSRLLLVLKVVLGWLILLPHIIILYVLSIIEGLAVLIVILVKLVTGNYPEGVFEFIMGVNRWGIRVSAYGNLMTDKYPPFSLSDDGQASAVQPSGAAGEPPSPSS